MSLSQLRIYLALIFFFLIGAIEYKVLTDNKQNLSMQYTKELKTLLYDISYLLVWEIEKENDVEAPLVKGILNNSNITHKYIKNIGLSSDNIVTYSTDKKMISNPLSKPLIMTETLDASQIFDDQYIGVTFNYYLGNSQYSQLLFIEIDQDIVQKHFWSTHVIPSIELILAILVFVAILLLMIDHLLVQPIINLSTLLPREDVENKLPTYYLTEMEFLKKRFLSAIRKIKNEQQEKALASSVFENTQEAILITDNQKRIVSVNNAFIHIFGYNLNELIGKNPKIIASGKHDKSFFSDMDHQIETIGQWNGELTNKSKAGKLVPVWVNISVIRDDNGNIMNYIAIYTDISKIKETQKRLEYMSQYDNLTGLLNKKTFEVLLNQTLKTAKKQKNQIAVLLIDIDNFQDVNDAFGHNIGDQYLITVSRKLQNYFQDNIIARVGGDEFLISLEQIDDIATTLDNIYILFSKPIMVQGHEFYVKLCTGISIFPHDGDNVETLIKNADAAMYKSKENGKDTYTFYQPAMTEAISHKIEMEKKLHQALKNNELTVYYQPQMSIRDKKILGVEALVRWIHPVEGMIPPDKFIPVAEMSNLIHEIGLYVLNQACTEFSTLTKAEIFKGTLAINFSSRQLQFNDIKESLYKVLLRSDLDPSKLEIEVTETLLMQNPEKISLILNELRELGITIAIDDFGTGYSSLSYLNTLPIDKLKIDKSFIDYITTDEGNKSICKAIIAMGNSLNIKTIAEGVETKEQMDLVESLGCDEIQGYYFAKPMDIEGLRKFILENKVQE